MTLQQLTATELPVVEYQEGMKIEVGKYYLNLPNDIYHGSDGDSKSSLDVFHQDPYKYFHRKQRDQTRAMQLGSAIHAAILEPKVFEKEYMLLPELKDRRQPEYKAAVKARGEGKVFTNADCEKIDGMQRAVWSNSEARELLLADGYCEVSGFAIDKESGLQIRHRFDKLACVDGEWWGVDIKKTVSVSDRDFSMSIWKYRYHVQDAIYSDGFEAITEKELAGFKFICVEEEYPHKVEIYELCDLSRKIGKDEARMDLNSLAMYKSGKIAAHNNEQSKIISLPEFVLNQYEQEIV